VTLSNLMYIILSVSEGKINGLTTIDILMICRQNCKHEISYWTIKGSINNV